MAGRTAGRSVSTEVLEVFQANRNKEIHINDIAAVTGYSRQQCRRAIAYYRYQGEPVGPLEIIQRGSIYKFKGTLPATRKNLSELVIDEPQETPEPELVEVSDKRKKLYEHVTTLRNGDELLQDEDGVLYRATVLED